MVRIGRRHPYFVGAGQAEDFCGDQRERGVGPTQIDRARGDLQAAIAVESTHRRSRVGRTWPAAGRQADTFMRTTGGAFVGVDDARTFEALRKTNARPRLAVSTKVALAARILDPQLERIDTQSAR